MIGEFFASPAIALADSAVIQSLGEKQVDLCILPFHFFVFLYLYIFVSSNHLESSKFLFCSLCVCILVSFIFCIFKFLYICGSFHHLDKGWSHRTNAMF